MGGSVKAPLEFHTARLTFTAPRPGDTVAIFERFASDPEVTRYLGWPRHRSVLDVTPPAISPAT